MKLIKLSSPGFDIEVKNETEAATKLWPYICMACRLDDPETETRAARLDDLQSMLNSACGCEFMID